MNLESEVRPLETGDWVQAIPISRGENKGDFFEYVSPEETTISTPIEIDCVLVEMEEYHTPQEMRVRGGQKGEKVVFTIYG